MDELTDLRNALWRLNAEHEKQVRPIVNRIIEIEADHRREAHDGTRQTPNDMGRFVTGSRDDEATATLQI